MNKIERFREIATDLADLYEQKNTAYGDSFGKSIQKYGKIAGLTRISDKFNRLESLILNSDINVGDERLRDTLLDMSAYCIMLAMEEEVEDHGNDKWTAPKLQETFERDGISDNTPFFILGDMMQSRKDHQHYEIREIATNKDFTSFIYSYALPHGPIVGACSLEHLLGQMNAMETASGDRGKAAWDLRKSELGRMEWKRWPKFEAGDKVIYTKETDPDAHTFEDVPCIVLENQIYLYHCAAGVNYFPAYKLQKIGSDTVYTNIWDTYVKGDKNE